MKKITLIFTFILATYVGYSQSYFYPESVAYDPSGQRYFISNVDENAILQLDSDSNLSYFAKDGLNDIIKRLFYKIDDENKNQGTDNYL